MSTATSYRLDADDAKLTPHVGHKVEITGTVGYDELDRGRKPDRWRGILVSELHGAQAESGLREDGLGDLHPSVAATGRGAHRRAPLYRSPSAMTEPQLVSSAGYVFTPQRARRRPLPALHQRWRAGVRRS